MPTLATVGHGTLSAPEFVDLVAGAGVEVIVDVRRYPGSQRHPHFGSDAMGAWLADAGLGYEWLPGLGGRRTVVDGSPNVALRNLQFRGYADHMATAEFGEAVAKLRPADRRIAVMCAESVWWRCHRRLLADHLILVEGDTVEHLFHDGRLVRHEPAPEASLHDGTVVYNSGAQVPLFGA